MSHGTKRAHDGDQQPARPVAPIRHPALREGFESHESRFSGLWRDIIVHLIDPMCRTAPGAMPAWPSNPEFHAERVAGPFDSDIIATCMLPCGMFVTAHASLSENPHYAINVWWPDFAQPDAAHTWAPEAGVRVVLGGLFALPGDRVGLLDVYKNCLRAYTIEGTPVGMFEFRDGGRVASPECGCALQNGMVLVLTREPHLGSLILWGLTRDLELITSGPLLSGFALSGQSPPRAGLFGGPHSIVAHRGGFVVAHHTNATYFDLHGRMGTVDRHGSARRFAYDAEDYQISTLNHMSHNCIELACAHGGSCIYVDARTCPSTVDQDTPRNVAIDRDGNIVITRQRDVLRLTLAN